jgi:hypothetical protein
MSCRGDVDTIGAAALLEGSMHNVTTGTVVDAHPGEQHTADGHGRARRKALTVDDVLKRC